MLQVRSVQADHDGLIAQNKSLAEYNLTIQPRLDSLKTEVATGYESINKLKTDLGMAKARLGRFLWIPLVLNAQSITKDHLRAVLI